MEVWDFGGGGKVGDGGWSLPSGVVCFSDMVGRLMQDANKILGSERIGQCMNVAVILKSLEVCEQS